MNAHLLKTLASSLLIFLAALAFRSAEARGPSKATSPTYTLPNPIRNVVVQPFQNVSAFETPNQVTTTLQQAQTALGNILNEVVTDAGFSVVQGGGVTDLDPCGKHLELWPAVTDFTMEAMSANITFGFNSMGSINVGQPQATAQDTIQVGSIAFEFTLYECDNNPNGSCTSLLASDANQSVLGNNFQFSVTYSVLTAGGDIINKTDLASAVQKIMANGVAQLAAGSAMASAPWETTVAAVNSDGSITILAGQTSNIASNQYFTIYAAASSTSACGVYQALACVATTEVDSPSSVAVVYKTLQAGESRSIQVGDVVEVGSPACAPGSSLGMGISPIRRL